MNPFLKAAIGSTIRWGMVLLGMHGVDVSADDSDTFMQALEAIGNGAMIALPLLWSWYQKYRTHQRIETDEQLLNMAARR